MNIPDYFIIANSSLGVSYCLYRLFFRHETRFSIQRFFLIGSVALSVILPLTHLRIEFRQFAKYPVAQEIITQGAGLAAQPQIEVTGLADQLYGKIPYIYTAVSAVLLMMLVINLLRIFRLYKCSDKLRAGKNLILRNNRIKSPFSFFSWVFIPHSISANEELESIILHEQVHADSLHSLDNIILELITAVMWFNPFLWMMKRSLHLVHEYQADEGTIRAGIEKTRYQALLINQVADEMLISISSSFNNNLKKRIIMMTKSKNTEQGRSGIVKLLPASAIMLFTVAVLNGVFIPSATASDGNQEKKQNNKDRNQEIVVTGYGSQPGSSIQVKDTINYIVDGVKVENIDNLSPDSIESVNVLKEDRTIIIRTKSYSRKHAPELKTSFNTGSDKVLYLKNGKIISREEMESINPSDIKNIDVLKRKESIQEYTDKDFDGVILITTKK